MNWKTHLTEFVIFLLIGISAIIISKFSWIRFITGWITIFLVDWFLIPVFKKRIIEDYIKKKGEQK